MKLEDALKLEPGQKVMHKRYGECSVHEVMMSCGELFGVVITPATEGGRLMLRLDSGSEVLNFLEDRIRNLSIENNIPGSKPIDQETAWAVPEEDLPAQPLKDHFAPSFQQPEGEDISVELEFPAGGVREGETDGESGNAE